MHLHLLAASVLEDILWVSLEAEKDVSWAANLHEFDFTLQDTLLFAHVLKPEQTFLIAEVYISLITSSCCPHVFNLLLIKHFICLFGISFQQIFRLVCE